MTTEQLKQKHKHATWSLNGSELEKHTDISIEFAIECLKDIIREYKMDNVQFLSRTNQKFRTIDDIILDKIKNLKQ